MIISQRGVAITNRFFSAIDALKEQKKLRGLKTFTRENEYNHGNVAHIKTHPDIAVLKPELLSLLCEKYNVSGEWLLTGKGAMFKK